jgi:hypothetical protein
MDSCWSGRRPVAGSWVHGYWTFDFHTKSRISWLTEQLLVFKKNLLHEINHLLFSSVNIFILNSMSVFRNYLLYNYNEDTFSTPELQIHAINSPSIPVSYIRLSEKSELFIRWGKQQTENTCTSYNSIKERAKFLLKEQSRTSYVRD